MESSTIRRRLMQAKRKIDAEFTAHIKTNGRNGSAEGSCGTCNRFWGALAAVDIALDLTEKSAHTINLNRITD